jgi:hypothetical protein
MRYSVARLAAEGGQIRPTVLSSFVKFRQAMSSFVKPLLDGDACIFNALPATRLIVDSLATLADRRRREPSRPMKQG